MKIFKIVIKTLLSIICLVVIIDSIIGIVNCFKVNTKNQEKVLTNYSKNFDIKKVNVVYEDEIIQKIEANKDGYDITFTYKNTELREQYNKDNELITKSFSNDIVISILGHVICILIFVLLMFAFNSLIN